MVLLDGLRLLLFDAALHSGACLYSYRRRVLAEVEVLVSGDRHLCFLALLCNEQHGCWNPVA